MTASHEVDLTLARVVLRGELTAPDAPAGVIVFAHGSGSSRRSPRNRAVADALVHGGFATLLFDLLAPDEDELDRARRFDIPLLARRLEEVLAWIAREPRTADLPIGLFGASTGAAAALVAAAHDHAVAAVVSRGGRPDLAGEPLAEVACPTLFVVGGADVEVLELNRRAMQQMTAPVKLVVVPGASHLFEEPGALRAVTDAALDWFRAHLAAAR